MDAIALFAGYGAMLVGVLMFVTGWCVMSIAGWRYLMSSGQKPPDYYDTMVTLPNAMEGRSNKAPVIIMIKQLFRGLLFGIVGLLITFFGKVLVAVSGIS
tara:strand:- start:1310 stop:1609 length:300 start_codon:yes stop_codon:yes gene_type:complete